MRNISSTADLKDAISELEFNKAVHRRMLIDSFNSTVESLKPGHVFSNLIAAFKNPSLLANIIPAAVGMGAGYISNQVAGRLLRARSGRSRLRRVLFTLALFGVTKAIVKSPDVNRIFGRRIVQSVFG